jgi:hypothetical protein
MFEKKNQDKADDEIKEVIQKEEENQKKKLELISIENRKLYKLNSFDFLQLETDCKIGYLDDKYAGEIQFFYAVKDIKHASNIPKKYAAFLESRRYTDYFEGSRMSTYKNEDKKNTKRFCDVGLNLKPGIIGSDFLMQFLCNYYKSKYDFSMGNKMALLAFRILWVKGINSIYEEQGVNISLKHFELVICQMTKKALVLSAPRKAILSFIVYEKVSSSYLMELVDTVQKMKDSLKEKEKELKRKGNLFELSIHQKKCQNMNLEIPRFIPIVMASSKAALEKRGFFSAAGFQETKNVLLKAAVEGKKDWFQGLKESIIIGKLIPAGTSFLTQRYSLDSLFFYQKKNSTLTTKATKSEEISKF